MQSLLGLANKSIYCQVGKDCANYVSYFYDEISLLASWI